MASRSSPRHRHDGTSPLPLGMDYSPPPSHWIGPQSVWPHDPRTGWSYCIMIPSWTTLSDAKAADSSNLASPIVFYRVHIGIQSPQGVSTMRKVLRRFSDFLKLHASLKRAFPKKMLPMTPPKNSTLWMKANQVSLEERRLALIDWLGKLLSDIDISRSAAVAAFFELEAAATAAMVSVKEAQLSTSVFVGTNLRSGISSVESVTSETEHGSDASYDVTGFEKDGAKPGEMDERFSLKDLDLVLDSDILETGSDAGHMDHTVSSEEAKGQHRRRPSVESIGSEISSARGSDFSFAATVDGNSESSQWDIFNHSSSQSLENVNADLLKGVHMTLPLDQRGNVRRLLVNLQRRLSTSKSDMEDLITRLNQESSVKEFLAAKVRDLEGELDSTRRKSKDLLQQALSMEQDAFNNLQWELEEAKASLDIANSKAIGQQEARILAEEKMKIAETEKELAKAEVFELKEQLQKLQKDRDHLEAKAKSELKVLAREIKTLRKSQPELKEELEMVIKDKTKLQNLIQSEIKRQEQQSIGRAKFLHEVANLRKRLQECSVEFLAKQDEKSLSKNPAVKDVMDLLLTSDSRIGLLAAEAQLLAEDKEDDQEVYTSFGKGDMANGFVTSSSKVAAQDTDLQSEIALRKVLAEIFMDNVQLYKVVNSMTLNAAVMDAKPEKGSIPDEASAKKNLSMLNRFL